MDQLTFLGGLAAFLGLSAFGCWALLHHRQNSVLIWLFILSLLFNFWFFGTTSLWILLSCLITFTSGFLLQNWYLKRQNLEKTDLADLSDIAAAQQAGQISRLQLQSRLLLGATFLFHLGLWGSLKWQADVIALIQSWGIGDLLELVRQEGRQFFDLPANDPTEASLLASPTPNWFEYLLPIGFSFLTLQQMAFLLDCHRQKIYRLNLITYGVFSLFYAKIIMGPVWRWQDWIWQIGVMEPTSEGAEKTELGRQDPLSQQAAAQEDALLANMPEYASTEALSDQITTELSYQLSDKPLSPSHSAIDVSDYMGQFGRVFHRNDIWAGLTLIIFGLMKKLLLADSLAPYVDQGISLFQQGVAVSLWEAWMIVCMAVAQLYFDISAYTDIALGAALCVGIRLPLAMDSPFMATGPIDFWRRWHVSLTALISDLIYRPLSGMTASDHDPMQWRYRRRMMEAFLLTFLLFALWHGSSGPLLIWGGLQGLLLALHQGGRYLFMRKHLYLVERITLRTILFPVMMLAWLPFFMPDLESVGLGYYALLGGYGLTWPVEVIQVVEGAISFLLPHLANLDGPVILSELIEKMIGWQDMVMKAPIAIPFQNLSIEAILLGAAAILMMLFGIDSHRLLKAYDPVCENLANPYEGLIWRFQLGYGILIGIGLFWILRAILTQDFQPFSYMQY